MSIKEQRDLFSLCTHNTFGLDNDSKFRWYANNVFDKSEFIPVIISSSNGCMISHKAYHDKDFKYHDAVTSPCLGKNIKKSEQIMERLKGWFDEGGTIKDNNLYLILQNRNPNKPTDLYLRRWNKE